MKKIAILQSNYIPWKGYFDIIGSVDEFILYDDMQYTKNDWRNRNIIKTPSGLKWLSIPVGQDINRRIRDVEISNPIWQEKHWKALLSNYSRAPYSKEIFTLFEPIYLEYKHTNLSEVNRILIKKICNYLGINTIIKNSWDYQLSHGKTERLVDLCIQSGATEYISGPAAKNYLQTEIFSNERICLKWFDYSGYTEYPQLWGSFQHGVSILDLLFNCGKNSPRHMKFRS
jgi:hypothetical protein